MKIGFVGVGDRVTAHYIPIAKTLDVDVVGFATRDQAKAAAVADRLGIAAYETPQALARDVDMMVVCVPMGAMHNVVCDIVETTRTHLLIETPIVSEQVAAASYVTGEDRRILAAENWPFRPAEVLKRDVVASGLIGRPTTVVNDFRGYEYHAMAMMRSIAGGGLPHVVFGSSFTTGDVSFVGEDGTQRTLAENWDVGVVTLETGVRLVHNFNSVHSRVKARGVRSLRVMGTNGCASSDDVGDLTVWCGGGRDTRVTHAGVAIGIHGNAVEVSLDVAGSTFTWKSGVPDSGLDEQGHSIRSLLEASIDAVQGKSMRAYPAWQSWIDWQCVQLLRTSSAWNRTVDFRRPTWMV